MARKIAVLFVHGIYNSSDTFHEPMRERLDKALPKALRPFVDYEAANWAPIVRRHQSAYMDKLIGERLVDDNSYRWMALQGLGDAAAYQKTRNWRNSAYYEIQHTVRAAVDRLDQRGDPDRPLVFIGHSLGCHILSTFAWDTYTMRRIMQNREQDGDTKMQEFAAYMREGSPFRRLETLAGFVTMGCNMPLFTFTFGPDKIVPITQGRTPNDHPAFPGMGLGANVKVKARWLNFYSRNDLLGFPLKPLNGAYAAEPRISDIPVVSEGRLKRILCSPFPALATYAAHTGYWTHGRVVRDTAALLTDIITADDPAPPPRRLFRRGGARVAETV
ncbi:MAG: hypothetical protein B7Y80_02130 [Hyphomicrobium sp. 32-62-53]|nr:MAG: hypothetical protein B7Z29_02480 [Hyphomicrobium sp. 12-62-95]OYY01542.1 MAG: hypothetical protein B7Y80_02130 [Hyphomicrobium sp. 32-62-53]